MTELDFTIEFNGEGLGESEEAAMFAEADTRLRELAGDHRDMTGAAINVREPAQGADGFLYEATVAVYIRPEQLAASKINKDPMMALKDALDAVERQVREKRARLRRRWERPGNDPVSMEVEEIIAAEGDENLSA